MNEITVTNAQIQKPFEATVPGSSRAPTRTPEGKTQSQPVFAAGTLPSTMQFLSGLSNVRFGSVQNVKKLTELHLKDYTPPSHLIDKTDLTFELLAEDNVVVTSRLTVRPNPAAQPPTTTLKVNGAP